MEAESATGVTQTEAGGEGRGTLRVQKREPTSSRWWEKKLKYDKYCYMYVIMVLLQSVC